MGQGAENQGQAHTFQRPASYYRPSHQRGSIIQRIHSLMKQYHQLGSKHKLVEDGSDSTMILCVGSGASVDRVWYQLRLQASTGGLRLHISEVSVY